MPFPLFILTSCVIAVATVGGTLALGRWRWPAVIVAFAGAYGLLVFHGAGFFRLFPVDDAYITFRYSKHLAEGLGPNWNSDGRVEGYTSFLWMGLLAGVDKAGVDLIEGARALIFISQLGTFGAVFLIWKLWADEHPGSGLDSPLLLATALVGLAITDGMAFWGFSGMETPVFTLFLTAGAYVFFLERRGGRYPWSALIFVAAALTRPEGVLAAAVTGAFALLDAVQGEDRRRALTRALAWQCVFLLLYGSYFIWRYSYYDYFFPNTFYAKVGPTSDVFQRGADYILGGVLKYYLLPLGAGIGLLFVLPRVGRDALYILALSAAMLGAVAVEGGDAFGHGRFIVPLLPLLYLGGLAGFATLLRRAPFDAPQVALAGAGILAIAALVLLRGSNNPYVPADRANHTERRLLGLWLSEHTPPDYTIAAFAIGTISYYSERDMLDPLGLNDVRIAHSDVPSFGSGIGGHEKYNVDYVLGEARPEIIITGDAEPTPLTAEQFRAQFAGPGGLPAKDAYFADPRIWQEYQVRSVNIEGLWFNFLQRKDTVAELNAPGLR